MAETRNWRMVTKDDLRNANKELTKAASKYKEVAVRHHWAIDNGVAECNIFITAKNPDGVYKHPICAQLKSQGFTVGLSEMATTFSPDGYTVPILISTKDPQVFSNFANQEIVAALDAADAKEKEQEQEQAEKAKANKGFAAEDAKGILNELAGIVMNKKYWEARDNPDAVNKTKDILSKSEDPSKQLDLIFAAVEGSTKSTIKKVKESVLSTLFQKPYRKTETQQLYDIILKGKNENPPRNNLLAELKAFRTKTMPETSSIKQSDLPPDITRHL